MRTHFRLTLVLVLSLLPNLVHATETDSVVFRFATVGDSRAEPSDSTLSAQDVIWLQSTRVLSRIIREIQVQQPQALVFNGDMIYGYSAERAVLDKQYAFWRGMMAQLFETGTYVLPVPGNHETQVMTVSPQGASVRLAAVSSEHAWRGNMGDLILNAPLWQEITRTAPRAWNAEHAPAIGADGIVSDQSLLSYSFDIDNVHFAIINTDPVGFDASAPVGWLATDFASAKTRGIKHIFVFGHKMAYTYMPGIRKLESGFDVRKPVRDAFWDLIEEYRATYFCGHEHVYHASQPRLKNGGKAWQVIVGSGGSPLSIRPEDAQSPADRMYAWAGVTVYRSGRVHIAAYGFDEGFGPTRLIDEWEIAAE